MITPDPRLKHDTGRVRRGDMTDEEYRVENERKAQLRAERQAVRRQQQQYEDQMYYLSQDDPSLYKAAMEKETPTSATELGTLTSLDDAYQSGETRMRLASELEGGTPSSLTKNVVGGGDYGIGLGDFIGGGFVDAADAWKYLKGASQRNRDARERVTQELVNEGYSTGSMDFFKELQKRLPEPEGSGEAMFDFGIGAIEALTLGTAKPVTSSLKFIADGGAARFLKGLATKLTMRVTSSSRGALPTANTAAEQVAREILELRAAGKADEVTEAMMSAADDPYMYANTPIDMSQEARMARAKAEGRVPALHGTGSDISAVDSAYFGSGKEDLLGSGFYTTTNPKRADRYLPIGNPPLERGVFQSGNKEYAEGANVMPLMVKELKPFNLEEPLGDVADQIAESYSKDPFFKVETMSSGVHIISNENGSAMLDPYLPKADALFKLRKAFGPEDVSMVLSDIGYSGVSGPEALGNRVRVSYNPEDVRSQFARFDPEFRNLTNLSASILSAIGFSGLAASLKEKESIGGDDG